MKKTIRILIVDDHFVVRIGLLMSLKMHPEIEVVAEASSGAQALSLYGRHLPDVAIMDLRLPDLSGIEVTARLRKKFSNAKVLMFSSYDGEEDIYRALQAGARGYVLKDVDDEELLRAIKVIHAGERYIPAYVALRLSEHRPNSDLSQRELEVLQLLIKGLSNKEIGELLGCTMDTAKFHVSNILAKLQVSDRTEAATAAFQRGILH